KRDQKDRDRRIASKTIANREAIARLTVKIGIKQTLFFQLGSEKAKNTDELRKDQKPMSVIDRRRQDLAKRLQFSGIRGGRLLVDKPRVGANLPESQQAHKQRVPDRTVRFALGFHRQHFVPRLTGKSLIQIPLWRLHIAKQGLLDFFRQLR